MSMNIDKPLDEMVSAARKSRNSNRAPRRGAAGPGGVAAPRVPAGPGAGARARYSGAAPAQNAAPPAGFVGIVGDKIIVSNLPDDVKEADVTGLFAGTVGPLRNVSLAYNARGKSTGVATIQFAKAAHATEAYKQYNGRIIDQNKKIRVEIIVDPSRVPPPSLGSRLGAAPINAPTAPAGGRQPKVVSIPAAAGGRGGGRGGRGGRRGGGARGENRPKATLESLDAEMSEYQGAAAAAVPAVAETA